MAGSDDLPGGVDHVVFVPAPDLDALGHCTVCQQPEEQHVTPDGVVSVREFHRAFLGANARFIDEA